MAVAEGTRTVQEILARVLDGERLADADALTLMRSKDLVAIGAAANEIRNRKADPGVVTFIVDRNINYSNICVTDCNFCAFYRQPGDTREGYTLPKPVIFAKIRETIEIGGTGALMQGGHNPDLGIEWYEDLFSSVKERYPTFHLHALSPPEIMHISRRSRLPIATTLSRLRDAGLDTLPGGGGEILVDRVRKILAPKKTKSDEWLEVMRQAHRQGMSTSATMMYGHVETPAEIVEHLLAVRALQDETGGFSSFIPWSFKPGNSTLGKKVKVAAHPLLYLRLLATARLVLDNVPHVQSSWFSEDLRTGQLGLLAGADDFGGLLFEESVLGKAGHAPKTSLERTLEVIRAMGFEPAQRNSFYAVIERYDASAVRRAG